MAGVQHLELADLQGPHNLQKGIVIFSLYSKQEARGTEGKETITTFLLPLQDLVMGQQGL